MLYHIGMVKLTLGLGLELVPAAVLVKVLSIDGIAVYVCILFGCLYLGLYFRLTTTLVTYKKVYFCTLISLVRLNSVNLLKSSCVRFPKFMAVVEFQERIHADSTFLVPFITNLIRLNSWFYRDRHTGTFTQIIKSLLEVRKLVYVFLYTCFTVFYGKRGLRATILLNRDIMSWVISNCFLTRIFNHFRSCLFFYEDVLSAFYCYEGQFYINFCCKFYYELPWILEFFNNQLE